MRVSRNSIIGNVSLSAFKLFAGVAAHSAAMISDAVHSLSDVLSTVIVMVGLKQAGRKADREHPYGHERMECVAAIILAAILCATGIGIGYAGVRRIVAGNYGEYAIPGALALVAAAVSIIVKESMYWYTRAAAKRIGSGALMADAWHHRSDALSSVGSLAGIAGARLGFPALDSAASVVICLFIVKTAFDIFKDAIGKMTDRACDDATIAELYEVIIRQNGVSGVDMLRTRLFGEKIYIDVEISADGDAPLHVTHDIAHRVHDSIEHSFPRVKHCMVHVNPAGERTESADEP
ncbi:MAG: cation diffusion facilitator family transporter [Oscillospiraceae bacterium]|jgi:cation diffusion facilitator family transporter|nr:cation diffusion facilitator family transporter [Oscillospiraceae bacterium]